MPGERRRIHLELTDDAIAGLDQLATRHRITRVAMAEALGRLHRTVTIPREVVELAHQIDRERRSRR